MTIYVVVTPDVNVDKIEVIFSSPGGILTLVYGDWHEFFSALSFVDSDIIFVKLNFTGR